MPEGPTLPVALGEKFWAVFVFESPGNYEAAKAAAVWWSVERSWPPYPGERWV